MNTYQEGPLNLFKNIHYLFLFMTLSIEEKRRGEREEERIE